jgi:hypothetical protein
LDLVSQAKIVDEKLIDDSQLNNKLQQTLTNPSYANNYRNPERGIVRF